MANMNIRTPRFYPDLINFLMSRGTEQNGNFDVITGSNLIGVQTGSEAELFDMRPLNKVDFNTSAGTSDHVLINIDTQSTTAKKSFVAILNHNMASADAKMLIKASDTESHVSAVDMGSATAMSNSVNVVNGAISTNHIAPSADGSTIVTFDESALQYFGIQFEGNSGGTFSSTDLFVGCILLGEVYEMPHAPDLEISRLISFNRLNDLQESLGGQRFSNLNTFGRTATTTSKSPFTTALNGADSFGGRLIYDLKFSFLNNTDLMPDEYGTRNATDDSFVEDVWNKTNGNHIPFVFSIDKDSVGSNAESEHIFGRFANNTLDMQQVAPDISNISLTIEEEF
jgi:hypothetical protein